ncbi:MAG: hypothetical protein RLZZ612_571 [Pseudomonadota bacterium]
MSTAASPKPSPRPTVAPALAPWLQRQLAQLLTQRGHALLLAGPSGLGQFDLSLALARAWLCEQPTPHGACGRCGACHAIDVRTHAELLVLLPDVLALPWGWPIDPNMAKKIESKEAKPSKWIRVEAARRVVEFAQTTRGRGAVKVVLVYPAERLNVESANTLLKTLEEPAGDVRFVLATESAHALPATIRSRCQTHALTWPDEAQALAWLQTCQPELDEAAWRVWLQAAGGRPSDALAWASRGLDPAVWAQLPKAIALGQADALLSTWAAADQLAVLQKLCHDLMAVAVGAAPRFFAAAHLPPAPTLHTLQAWAKTLNDTARTVEHPFHAALALDAWLAGAQRVWSVPEKSHRSI